MSEVQTVPEETKDSVMTAKADAKQERERSKIEFPYTSLDLAVILAKAVHELGNQCDWAQLGARLDMAADGGGFRLRLMAAKTFGLISYTSRTVTLTPLGMRINDPDQIAAAKVESFLTVPLYKSVYEQYRNGTLPGAEGLENAMVTLGVAQKQKDKARQAFQRSATEAGFFAFGPNRLVAPALKAGTKSDTPPPAPHVPQVDNGKGGDGGGWNDNPPLHPFIKGLLDKLPEPETEWTLEGRKKWLQTALNIFDLMYTASPTDSGELSISLPKTSAN